MTPTFNDAAQKQVFDYAAAVAQAWRDFPDSKDKVIFLDLCKPVGQMLVYPAEGGREEMRKKVDGHGFLPRLIEEYVAKQGFCCMPGTHGERYLLIYTQQQQGLDLLGKTATPAQELAFAFDHELGHAVIPDGASYGSNDYIPECIADAYAVIRHFQRFGADSNALDALAAARAYYMIFKKERWDHFTSPVIAELLERRYEIDWNALSPQETAQLAHDFAFKYAMERHTLLDLQDSFDRYQGHNDDIKAGDDKYLRTLAEKVLSLDFSNMTKAGVAALKFCLEGNIHGASFEDDYWQQVKTIVAGKHKALFPQKYIQRDPEAQPPSYTRYQASGPSSHARRL